MANFEARVKQGTVVIEETKTAAKKEETAEMSENNAQVKHNNLLRTILNHFLKEDTPAEQVSQFLKIEKLLNDLCFYFGAGAMIGSGISLILAICAYPPEWHLCPLFGIFAVIVWILNS